MFPPFAGIKSGLVAQLVRAGHSLSCFTPAAGHFLGHIFNQYLIFTLIYKEIRIKLQGHFYG